MDLREYADWAAYGVKIQPSLRDLSKVAIFEDFEGAAINLADGKWASNTVQTGGTPTAALVADAANGEFALTLDATNEVQRAELYWGDQLNIDITKKPVMSIRAKVTTIAANEFVVMGFAAARNNTYDDIVTNLWVRLDANMNILVEGDDGTTDTDDQDTTIDAVAGTYLDLKIDASDLSAVEFSIDGTRRSTIAIAAATGVLQPFIAVGKASGTGVPAVTVDLITLQWDRT